MPTVVDEKFFQNLYADPSGQRKGPTIFDEMRWALQHADKPLEQITQLIAEIHGPFNGMTACTASLMELLGSLGSATSSVSNIAGALSLLEAVTAAMQSSIGKLNNITASQMSIPMLRQFITKAQQLHPAINNYIQTNIGKFPFFQQISDDVGSLGQIVLNKIDVPPVDRVNSDGAINMQTSCRLGRRPASKIFKTINTLVEEQHNLVDTLFFRAMHPENNIGLLKTDYGKSGSAISHGHNFCMDGFNAQRKKDAVQPCLMKALDKFGAVLQLCNTYFPVENKAVAIPKIFCALEAEGKQYMADGFNRPLPRQVSEPVAKEENKTSDA